MRNERRKRAGTVSRKTGPAEKLRGANLGNWLVLEKWMQPSMFADTDAEDETWYHRRMQKDPELRERRRRHRETYVTEEDFRQIAAAELNLVRIPVPYYVFGDREGIPGCVGYLDRAFVWAEKYGLRILIDLHTVPGGQNGYDNGGIVGVCRWHRNGADVEYVLSVLERLAASGFVTKKNVLMDFGSGKGRVDFYLAWQIGCRCIGVDYDRVLDVVGQVLHESALTAGERRHLLYDIEHLVFHLRLRSLSLYRLSLHALCNFQDFTLVGVTLHIECADSGIGLHGNHPCRKS